MADRVREYYGSAHHRMPAGWKGELELTLPRTFNGVEYDEFGFPRFQGSQVAQPHDKFEIVGMIGDNYHDYDKARTALEAKLRQIDGNATVEPGSPFSYVLDGVIHGPFTWHHMQDGKTMQAVEEAIHSGVSGRHTGGAFFARPDSPFADLKNFFDVF